jgi:predicted porin
MKNKLMLTTALAGLALSTSAFAETKITGSMTLTYGAASGPTAAESNSGYGRETQIDIRNSGDLNNGMKYEAGMSLEQDGTQAGFDGGEQVFINFISGDTTISFGQDHMPSMSGTIVPRVGKMLGTATAGINARPENPAQGILYLNDPLDSIYSSFGLGLKQKISGGTFTFNYVPSVDDAGTVDAGGGDGTSGNAAYEATYNGSFSGVGIKLGYKHMEKDASNTNVVGDKDGKAYQYGLGYSFGALKVGVQRNDVEPGTATSTDYDTTEVGIAYAINDKLSISASHATTDKDGTTADEDINEVSIGYNLGAVGIVLQYAEIENINGSSAANEDGEKLALRLTTAF